MFILALAGAALVGLFWLQSAPIRAGGWRVGAGLFAAVLIVVGAGIAIRGDWPVGLAMVAGGLFAALAGRAKRRPAGANARAPLRESMSLTEARAILGVEEGASAADITAAYRRLMMRLHPDQGGTEGLAVKLNAARDRLLGG